MALIENCKEVVSNMDSRLHDMRQNERQWQIQTEKSIHEKLENKIKLVLTNLEQNQRDNNRVISDLHFEMLQTESYLSQYLPLNMQTQTLQLLFKTVHDPLFFNSLIDFGSRLKKKLQQQ